MSTSWFNGAKGWVTIDALSRTRWRLGGESRNSNSRRAHYCTDRDNNHGGTDHHQLAPLHSTFARDAPVKTSGSNSAAASRRCCW